MKFNGQEERQDDKREGGQRERGKWRSRRESEQPHERMDDDIMDM